MHALAPIHRIHRVRRLFQRLPRRYHRRLVAVAVPIPIWRKFIRQMVRCDANCCNVFGVVNFSGSIVRAVCRRHCNDRSEVVGRGETWKHRVQVCAWNARNSMRCISIDPCPRSRPNELNTANCRLRFRPSNKNRIQSKRRRLIRCESHTGNVWQHRPTIANEWVPTNRS